MIEAFFYFNQLKVKHYMYQNHWVYELSIILVMGTFATKKLPEAKI